jgi:phage shock protein E
MFDFIIPNVPQVEAKNLFDAINSGQNIIILDVRTPHEYSKEKIGGSINLPVDQIEEKVENFIKDKKSKIYVYCLSGSRSVFAVNAMVKLGYTDVFNVKSGLLAWRVNKLPLISHNY